MKTVDLIREIEKLPVQKRFFVIEKTIHSIRRREDHNQMRKAAEALSLEYKTNKNLTAFTSLDYEDFYETR